MGCASADRHPFLASNKDPWKVKYASLHSHQKVVEYYRKMMSSPLVRWRRRRLHEGRSKVLCCQCRESQPCHGDVILRVFAEAMSKEKQRGGAPPRLEGIGLCEVERALRGHLCLSPRRRGLAMEEMLKGCSLFSRAKDFPTMAERELSMICATVNQSLPSSGMKTMWMSGCFSSNGR